MSKFLIIQTAFIGDVILATAVIEKLRNHHPAATIDFLLRKGNESLFFNHPHINKTIIWEKKNRKYRNLISIIKEIRQEKYDYVFNLQRFTGTGLITALSGAKKTIGFDKNPFSYLFTQQIPHIIGDKANPSHEIKRNHALIESLTDATYALPKLYPSENDFTIINQYTQHPFICIAPTSVWFTKQFPSHKWTSFINAISSYDLNIYLIGGKPDFETCQSILSNSAGNVSNLAGKLSLLQTAALMSKAKMNYVNDSAPMHLASSMNAPVTAIYCSTVPYFGFGPLSNKSYIIETKEQLTCRPCGLHGFKKCPKNHFRCAETIEIQELINILHENISSK